MERAKASRIHKIKRYTSLLASEYKAPSLHSKADPLDELVSILLLGKTDGEKYIKAFQRLKASFPHWEDVTSADGREVECLIREAEIGTRKAKLLKEMLRDIVTKFGSLDLSVLAKMPLDEAEAELIQLPGVGRKTARCVLLYCFGAPVLPVDVHTYRLAIRLGILSRRVSYERSHIILQGLIPEDLRRAFHVNAVAHGRARCFAHSPNCHGCPLTEFCSHPKSAKPASIEVRPRQMVVDLFAGAGGLSLGFEKGGFRVVQAVEHNPKTAETYRYNHPGTDLLEDDIQSLDPFACLQRLGLRRGDVTVLTGGPPCQGFSESNRRTRTLDNPRNYLFEEFLRFLDVIRPVWFVMENVAGLLTLAKGTILQQIINGCDRLGYRADVSVLNAADYGVPQIRRRLFIIGNRLDLPIRFPTPSHGAWEKPYVRVCDAVRDLPELENGASIDYLPYKRGHQLTSYQRKMRAAHEGPLVQGNLVSCNSQKISLRYQHIAPGQNWEAIPQDLMDNYEDTSRCHTGIYYRLKWEVPAKVIGNFRKNMLIHPEKHRGLSIREAARLQSFPDKYPFLGSIGFQQQQVADAVPPLLAEGVAREVKRIG